METKLLIEIGDLEQGRYFIEKGYGSLLLNVKGVTYTKQFNCYTDELSILIGLAKKNNVELFINLDMLYHEDDLIGLRAILKKLVSLDFKNLVICDIGVIELASDLGLEFNFINGNATLNTNYQTIESTSLFYQGFFLSNEININEIVTIIKETTPNTFVQVFGKQKMFSSKRKLLSAYLDYHQITEVTINPKSYLIIKDTTNDDNYSYVYEDQFGTHIYTRNNVNGLEYLKTLVDNKVSYLYLNNLFCQKEEYAKVVEVFYQYLNDNSYELVNAQSDLATISTNLSKSFFADETIFTIEQARLLEMGSKNV